MLAGAGLCQDKRKKKREFKKGDGLQNAEISRNIIIDYQHIDGLQIQKV